MSFAIVAGPAHLIEQWMPRAQAITRAGWRTYLGYVVNGYGNADDYSWTHPTTGDQLEARFFDDIEDAKAWVRDDIARREEQMQ